MHITVLTMPGCPNASLAQQRVFAALAGRAADVALVQVHDQAQAAEWAMTGSPTILLEGMDPFPPIGAKPSLSCRLYRAADGTVAGAPSEAELRKAIDEAGRTEPDARAES